MPEAEPRPALSDADLDDVAARWRVRLGDRRDVALLLAEVRRLRAHGRGGRLMPTDGEGLPANYDARLSFDDTIERLTRERDEARDHVTRLTAALAELVWVTNRSGETFCDLCAVPREDPTGKAGCSCEPLRGGPTTTAGRAGPSAPEEGAS